MPRTAEQDCRLSLDGREIPYRLRRSLRRTIGLTIDQHGLRVAAPQRATLGDIDALIRRHRQWVLDKLDVWSGRLPKVRLQVETGTVVFLLGRPLTVSIDAQRQRGYEIDTSLRQLTLNSSLTAGEALVNALKSEARQFFAMRLAHYVQLMGVPLPPLRLSSARTRWGSCNHRGQISLNWRLVMLPEPLIDYVVVHELAHLREMNHSPRFWSVVAQLCPEWQLRRQELKQQGALLPDF